MRMRMGVGGSWAACSLLAGSLLVTYVGPDPIGTVRTARADIGYACTLITNEQTTGAGQCPGGYGSACESTTYTKTAMCNGDCPAKKSCGAVESTTQVIYRQRTYSGNCSPPSNCTLVRETTLTSMIPSVCACVTSQPG
jgi:hypothetical protein